MNGRCLVFAMLAMAASGAELSVVERDGGFAVERDGRTVVSAVRYDCGEVPAEAVRRNALTTSRGDRVWNVWCEEREHSFRLEVAARTDGACTADGATDWAKAEANVLKAVSADDWSDLYRNTYWKWTGQDLRLNVICDVAGELDKAGRKDLAGDLLVKGAKALGYTRKATALEVDLVDTPEFAKRVKKLDDAMAKVGVSRSE